MLMVSRKIQLKSNNRVTPCPKCGNNTMFTVRAERCAEDCCDTWVVCVCGYDPTGEIPGSRYENVWGEVDESAALVAFDCWNDAITSRVS